MCKIQNNRRTINFSKILTIESDLINVFANQKARRKDSDSNNLIITSYILYYSTLDYNQFTI